MERLVSSRSVAALALPPRRTSDPPTDLPPDAPLDMPIQDLWAPYPDIAARNPFRAENARALALLIAALAARGTMAADLTPRGACDALAKLEIPAARIFPHSEKNSSQVRGSDQPCSLKRPRL